MASEPLPSAVAEPDVEVWLPSEDRAARLVRVPVEAPAAWAAGLRIAVDPASSGHVSAAVEGAVLRLLLPPTGEVRHVSITARGDDAVALWQPGSGENRGRLAPSWAAPTERGSFGGPAIAVLVGRGDTALAGVTASGPHRIRFRAGMIEETAELLVDLTDDGADERPLALTIDLRGLGFATAVQDLGREVGLTGPGIRAADAEPVYCTWYSLHQSMTGEVVEAEAARAAALGFRTVIVDDGWQTADASRGYGSCGDWTVERAKFPDGRAFVTRLRELGMRTMWWIGTPFVGHRSAAYAAGEYALQHDDAGMEAGVLDPRSAGSRRVLVERLTRLLDDTGADGFKIDFLERFGGPRPARTPVDADVEALEDGGLALLDELRAAAGPDLMVEFREPYLSAETVGRATMLRVGDCPLSPVQNRLGVVDMRLLSTGVAIHADPVMWGPGDSAERVAQHLLGALFAVPQVSVLLTRISDEHEAVLAHWLAFQREHRDLLLTGPLEVRGVAEDYPVVQVRDAGTVITARYAEEVVDVPEGAWTTWHLVNAADGAAIVRGGGPARVTVLDAAGVVLLTEEDVDLALAALPVPAGGRAIVIR